MKIGWDVRLSAGLAGLLAPLLEWMTSTRWLWNAATSSGTGDCSSAASLAPGRRLLGGEGPLGVGAAAVDDAVENGGVGGREGGGDGVEARIDGAAVAASVAESRGCGDNGL